MTRFIPKLLALNKSQCRRKSPKNGQFLGPTFHEVRPRIGENGDRRKRENSSRI